MSIGEQQCCSVKDTPEQVDVMVERYFRTSLPGVVSVLFGIYGDLVPSYSERSRLEPGRVYCYLSELCGSVFLTILREAFQ